jgi:hypothetical protein
MSHVTQTILSFLPRTIGSIINYMSGGRKAGGGGVGEGSGRERGGRENYSTEGDA